MTEDFELKPYARLGYIPQGRKCDELIKAMTKAIPGDGYLPSHRWMYKSQEHFVQEYGDIGAVLWAAASSSHTLIVNGQLVLRIWSDVDKHCWVDSFPHLLSEFSCEPVPEGNVKKSKPFTHRAKLGTVEQMVSLATHVKSVFGFK